MRGNREKERERLRDREIEMKRERKKEKYGEIEGVIVRWVKFENMHVVQKIDGHRGYVDVCKARAKDS